jgi:PAS domain S-box-containing protein
MEVAAPRTGWGIGPWSYWETALMSPASMNDGDLLHILLEQLPDAMYFKDADCRYLRVNRTLATWYGLKSPEEAVGKTAASFFSPEFARHSDEAEKEILKTGIPQVDVEEKLVWPDGRVMVTSTTRLPLRDSSGAVIGTLGIFQDLGPHLQAKKEIRRVEATYRSLVDNLPQNFFRKDLEGRVIFGNREYCKTLGKTLKELAGLTDFDLFPEHLARKYREDDERVMRTGHALDVIEAHKPPGKGVIFVRVVKTPVYDSEQRPIGVQGIFWEVPPQKEAKPAKAGKKAAKAPAAKRAKKAKKK